MAFCEPELKTAVPLSERGQFYRRLAGAVYCSLIYDLVRFVHNDPVSRGVGKGSPIASIGYRPCGTFLTIILNHKVNEQMIGRIG